MPQFVFKPKLFEALKNYSFQQFTTDLSAGVIVGIVAIPLSIAFAIASGVSPEKGLYTAIIAGFLISFLGGTSVQIGGPTGAFIVIIYSIIQKYGIDGLILATIIAGVFLVIMGLIQLGTIIKFIPYPVIVGFTGGIALTIFSTQINDLLGLGLTNLPGDFLDKWQCYFTHLDQMNPTAIAISAATILMILLFQRFFPKIPGAVFALLLTTLVTQLFQLPIETIGSRFGEIPDHLPTLRLPKFSFATIHELMVPAFTIALLGGIESLLSAVVADGMIGKKHNSNTELIATGLANITSALFGGLPATGAIARTATNIKNGGKTPVAGIVHALFLLLILLFFGKLASWIPLPCLAGILVVVSYNMSEWRTFVSLLKAPKSDVLILFTTFFLTVIFDLTIALEVGIILALVLFIRKSTEVSSVEIITNEFVEEKEINDPFAVSRLHVPEEVEIYEIRGSLFFGAAEKFKEQMFLLQRPPKVRIIRMRHVPLLDSTGLKVLDDIYRDCVKKKTILILSGVQDQPQKTLLKYRFNEKIGDANILPNIHDAVERAKTLLGLNTTKLPDMITRGGLYSMETENPADTIRRCMAKISLPDSIHKEELENQLLLRENFTTGSIGRGVAAVHPQNICLQNSAEDFAAVCYLTQDIDYHAYDNIPVHTVFILATSSQETLKTILSELAKWIQEEEFLDLLRERAPKEKLIRYLMNQQ